ncbi:hypothetical protein [Flavobacterium sp. WC2509]|uniref:hypothetical protein n=1 Tax=Flavobacterium sp. WC2509 TaxID=3461406 RepID=UPI00404490F3
MIKNADEPEQYHLNKSKTNKEQERIYKEKAFFINKRIFWFGIIATLFSVIASIIAYNISSVFEYVIWGTIQFLFFVVIISKHPKTIKALKMLSAISLVYLASMILVNAITLEDKKLVFQLKDLKFVLIYITVYFGAEQFIEVKKMQINKI